MAPQVIWIAFSDDGQRNAGRHIRRWASEPFEGATEYRIHLEAPRSIADLNPDGDGPLPVYGTKL